MPQNNESYPVNQPIIGLPKPVASLSVSQVKKEPQNDNFGLSYQSNIKKEPVENQEIKCDAPITMQKGFVFPKPVPSVIR